MDSADRGRSFRKATALASWTVHIPPAEAEWPPEQICKFSPSGRLLFFSRETRSDRLLVVDLFFGNSMNLTITGRKLQYIPVGELDGIAIADKFARAEINLQSGQLEVDWRAAEKLPNTANTFLGHRSGYFSFFKAAGHNRFEVSIRNLNAEAEAEKWIRFQLNDQPISLDIRGDSVLVLTDGVRTQKPIKRYSLRRKTLTAVEIPGFGAIIPNNLRVYFWLNGKLYTHFQIFHAKWEFLVLDVERRERYPMDFEYAQANERFERGYVCGSPLGILGVLTPLDRDTVDFSFRAELIPLGKPLPLRLLSHFRLLNSGRRFENLPTNDVVSPLFGPNPYRAQPET